MPLDGPPRPWPARGLTAPGGQTRRPSWSSALAPAEERRQTSGHPRFPPAPAQARAGKGRPHPPVRPPGMLDRRPPGLGVKRPSAPAQAGRDPPVLGPSAPGRRLGPRLLLSVRRGRGGSGRPPASGGLGQASRHADPRRGRPARSCAAPAGQQAAPGCSWEIEGGTPGEPGRPAPRFPSATPGCRPPTAEVRAVIQETPRTPTAPMKRR